MNTNTRAAVVIALGVVVLLVLFSGGAMSGGRTGGGMMGGAWMGGFGWMGIPAGIDCRSSGAAGLGDRREEEVTGLVNDVI